MKSTALTINKLRQIEYEIDEINQRADQSEELSFSDEIRLENLIVLLRKSYKSARIAEIGLQVIQ